MPETRAAIEADCIADQERQARGGAGLAPPMAPQAPADADMARFQQRQEAEIAANQEAFKPSRCADLSRLAETRRKEGC